MSDIKSATVRYVLVELAIEDGYGDEERSAEALGESIEAHLHTVTVTNRFEIEAVTVGALREVYEVLHEEHEELEAALREGNGDYERPTSSCGCGYEVVWVNGHWEHDAPPSFWGDDHDAHADEPDEDDPARVYWDIEDGIVEDPDELEITDERDVANAEINRITAQRKREEGS